MKMSKAPRLCCAERPAVHGGGGCGRPSVQGHGRRSCRLLVCLHHFEEQLTERPNLLVVPAPVVCQVRARWRGGSEGFGRERRVRKDVEGKPDGCPESLQRFGIETFRPVVGRWHTQSLLSTELGDVGLDGLVDEGELLGEGEGGDGGEEVLDLDARAAGFGG